MSTTPRKVAAKMTAQTAKLQRLTSSPSSINLPPRLSHLELTFAARNRDYGARKFVKNMLPSIAYKNPRLKITVNRPETVENPQMVLKFDDETTQSMDIKMLRDTDILESLKKVSDGQKLEGFNQPSSQPSTSTAPEESNASITADIQPPDGAEIPKGELEAGVDYGTARQ